MAAKLQQIEMAVVPDELGDASWLYQDDMGFEDRRAAYERGEFGLVGVQAVAEILVPNGGDSYIIQTITSPGLWGIESDSGDDYLNEVYLEERATLLHMLDELGVRQPCRGCGESFPHNPDADYCPKCAAENAGDTI